MYVRICIIYLYLLIVYWKNFIKKTHLYLTDILILRKFQEKIKPWNLYDLEEERIFDRANASQRDCQQLLTNYSDPLNQRGHFSRVPRAIELVRHSTLFPCSTLDLFSTSRQSPPANRNNFLMNKQERHHPSSCGPWFSTFNNVSHFWPNKHFSFAYLILQFKRWKSKASKILRKKMSI